MRSSSRMSAASALRPSGVSATVLALLVAAASVLCVGEVSAARGTPVSPLIITSSGRLYGFESSTSIQGAFWAHQNWQTKALQHTGAKAQPPPAVVAKMDPNGGLGNRIPLVVTGYLMALMTGRVFLLQESQQFTDYFKLSLPSNWGHYGSLYDNASRCTVSKPEQLASEGPAFCALNTIGNGTNALVANVTLVEYSSIDYDVPLLQVNPTLAPYFKHLVPDGEVFHHVSKLLLEPTQKVKLGMLPYLGQASHCLVGVHLRHHKRNLFESDLRRQQFAGIARSLSRGSEYGNIFVASDKDCFEEVASLVKDREVWWNNATKLDVSLRHTVGGNPGSEFSAVLGLLLLSRCKHIFVTAGSSFGCMAAGLGGVKPVYAAYGHHTTPF